MEFEERVAVMLLTTGLLFTFMFLNCGSTERMCITVSSHHPENCHVFRDGVTIKIPVREENSS